MTDSSFVNIFSEQFAPGLELSFTLGLTSNNDLGGTPDGFTFFLLDKFGFPIPTLAPVGDYFFTAALSSSGPAFSAYGSDPNRPLSVGPPVSIPAPTIIPVGSVPEPRSMFPLGAVLIAAGLAKHRLWRKSLR